MTSPCIKDQDKPCGCFVRRMVCRLRDRIKNPTIWFLVLWLGGLMAVLAASTVVKLLIYILKKTVH